MDTSYRGTSPSIKRPMIAWESYQSINNPEATFSGRSTNPLQALRLELESIINPLELPKLKPLPSYGVSEAKEPVQQVSSERAQLPRKSSHSSTDTAMPTAVKVAREHDDISESPSSAYVPPSFNDDDEFYILYPSGDHGSPGTLRQDAIEALNIDHPGIFDDLADVSDLFRDPARYQPVARGIHKFEYLDCLLENEGKPILWRVEKTTYGVYKHGCYKTVKNGNGRNYIEIDHDRYSAIKKNTLDSHVDQLGSSLASTTI